MDFPTTSGTPSGGTPPARPASPNVAPAPAVMPNRDNDTIYTMPDKFMQTTATPTTTKTHSKVKTWVLIAVIAVAVIAIIGGVVYYVLSGLKQQAAPAEPVVVNNEAIVNEANSNDTNVNENTTTNTLVTNGRLTNLNTSTNSTANTNTTNVNAVNTNSATNANSNSNTNSAIVVPSKDTDKDQLTNEEEAIFTTKADKPDTDSDGYIDGQEVIAGYDPNNAVSSGRLSAAATITTYESTAYGYSIQYPKNWLAQALSEATPNEMLFTSQSVDTAGQFIEVLVADNPTGYTATDWYTSQTGNAESGLTPITTFSGWEGVLSPDGYTAYFTTNKQAYIVSYRFGSSTEVYFPSTFIFMAKSFTQVKGTKATTTNSNSTGNSNSNANSVNQ